MQLRQTCTASWALTVLDRVTERSANCSVVISLIPSWREMGPCAAWRRWWVSVSSCVTAGSDPEEWLLFWQQLCSCFAGVAAYYYGSGGCNQFWKYQECSFSLWDQEGVQKKELKKNFERKETFWKKYQFYNHCKGLTQERAVLLLSRNKISRLFSVCLSACVWKQTPFFPAFASCRQGRAVTGNRGVLWL